MKIVPQNQSVEIEKRVTIYQDKQIEIIKFTASKNQVLERTFEFFVEKLIPDVNLRIILDFSSLNYVDSSFLAKVGDLHKKLAEKNGSLVLVNLTGSTRKLMEITRLDKFFTIEDSLEMALEKI